VILQVRQYHLLKSKTMVVILGLNVKFVVSWAGLFVFGLLAFVDYLRPASAVANIAETFVGGNDMHSIVERFNKWMDDVAGCESKVETSYIPGFRLGLIARDDIAEGEVYLKVPWMSLIHEESILNTADGQMFNSLRTKYELDIFHFLMLFFLREIELADSYWRPFLDILPNSHNTPIFWSDELLDELVGTRIPSEARKYRETARANFQKDYAIVSENVDFFGQVVLDKLDFDQYLWASNVLDSRTIWVNGRHRVFLPVLDMANNKDHPSKAHRTIRNAETGDSNTPSIWAVSKGEQLFENYNTPNFDNLLYHGFVLTENTHETVVLNMPPPGKEYYQTLGAVRARPKYSIRIGEGLAPEVLSHCRVVTQQAKDLDADPTTYMIARDALSEYNALAFLEDVLNHHLGLFTEASIICLVQLWEH
jgi:hypothetical protein